MTYNTKTEDKNFKFIRLGSAVLYGSLSFAITIVNKTVLTTYKFPSFLVLACGQLLSTLFSLYFLKKLKLIEFPDFKKNTLAKIFPLPLWHMANMVFGLGATQAVNLPMFTALRRTTILVTMVVEFLILGSKPPKAAQMCVLVMVLAALFASFDDLSFNLIGYTYIMLANFFTAINGVTIKQKLDGPEMGKYGLMFYNCLFVFVPTFVLAWVFGDIDKAIQFKDWDNPMFVVQFILSCFMGFVLSYATLLCTQLNSALTTTVVGGFKDMCMPFVGMFVGGDYIFSWPNFIGINISATSWLAYVYITFRRNQIKKVVQVFSVGPCQEKVQNDSH